MVVGTAVSRIVDSAENRMKFDIEEIESGDLGAYLSLTRDPVAVGCLEDLHSSTEDGKSPPTINSQVLPLRKKEVVKALQPAKAPKDRKAPLVQEIDDGIPTYAKPDSDPEDEDEDPTVIQRDKPTAPVYIRELLAGLKDEENYDRHHLALSTAASLIRRKTNFGTEVSDHVEELATRLVGLKDTFELPDFQELRLRGMIAVVVARPVEMGQWFANTLFNGDYSMSQRASILTALSMAARELAGYRDDDAKLTGAALPNEDLFPSKRLPEKVERRLVAGQVDELSKRLEQSMIRPLALKAADKLTGPDILKVRTFSSRMEVEKKRKKPITNELAKVVADGFFFPLTGHFRSHMQAQ